MPIYFMLLDARQFHQDIVPALSISWRQRSFALLAPDFMPPSAARRAELRGEVHVPGGQTIHGQGCARLAIDRDRWKLVVGEILLFAAAEVPEIEVVPETMLCLLAADAYLNETVERRNFRQSSKRMRALATLTSAARCTGRKRAGLQRYSGC